MSFTYLINTVFQSRRHPLSPTYSAASSFSLLPLFYWWPHWSLISYLLSHSVKSSISFVFWIFCLFSCFTFFFSSSNVECKVSLHCCAGFLPPATLCSCGLCFWGICECVCACTRGCECVWVEGGLALPVLPWCPWSWQPVFCLPASMHCLLVSYVSFCSQPGPSLLLSWPSFVSPGCCGPLDPCVSWAALGCRASISSQAFGCLEHLSSWSHQAYGKFHILSILQWCQCATKRWLQLFFCLASLFLQAPWGCSCWGGSSPRTSNRPLCLEQSLHLFWHTVHLWSCGSKRGEQGRGDSQPLSSLAAFCSCH